MPSVAATFLLVACHAVLPFPQPENTSTDDSLTITVNAQHLGLGSDVNDYPLVLRLDTTSFPEIATDTEPGGANLRFENATGTRLPHEIGSWLDNTSGTVWVLVDTIYAGKPTVITMYCDRPDAPNPPGSETVFDADSALDGVWHLNEDAEDGATSTLHVDSTTNAMHLQQNGNHSVPGLLSSAQSFDGVSDRICGRTGPETSGADAFSTSGWVRMAKKPEGGEVYRVSSITGQAAVAGFGIGSFGYHVDLYNSETTQKVGLGLIFDVNVPGIGDVGQKLWERGPTTELELNTWYHIAVTSDGQKISFYVNGAPDGEHSYIPGVEAVGEISVCVGGDGKNDSTNFNGLVDEARGQQGVVDGDRIKLDFETQRPNQDVVIW